MIRPNYTVEASVDGGETWRTVLADTRDWCLGYLSCHQEQPGPRRALRVRDMRTGRIVDSVPEERNVGLGMVAGHPTAQQYRDAAAAALAKADEIERREAARAARMGER